MEEFVNHVSAMGINIDSLNIDIKDKTFEYLSTRLKAKNKENFTTREETTKSANQEKILQGKDDLIDRHLTNSRLDDSVKNSTITLFFYETNVIKKEIIANDDLSAYNPPFFTRLTLALQTGWNLFVDLIVGLANIWVLLLSACAAWFIYKRVITKRTIAPKA